MATTRFPDTTDSQITESNWTGSNAAISDNRRVTGCDLTVSSGLDLSVGTGVVLIDGMRVEINVAETVSLTANSTNRVWIQKNGTVYDNTSITPTASTDFLLGVVFTNASAITAIYTDYDLQNAASLNYEWFPRLLNHATTGPIGAATSATLVDIDLEPGLYWVNGIIQGEGQALSGGQSWTLTVDVITSAESGAEIAFLNHGDEGANDDSDWALLGVGETFEGTSNTIPNPVHVVGMVYLADTGTLRFSASTSSHFAVGSSHITARKIR